MYTEAQSRPNLATIQAKVLQCSTQLGLVRPLTKTGIKITIAG